MNAQQQQLYLQIRQKLHDGTSLSRGEQMWLLHLLSVPQIEKYFFGTKVGRSRSVDLHFWMTMDSLVSGDAEKVVAARWQQPGRIATVLNRWRRVCEQRLTDCPAETTSEQWRALWKGWVNFARPFVSKPARVSVQKTSRRKQKRR